MSREAIFLHDGGNGVKPIPRKTPTPKPKPQTDNPPHPPVAQPTTAKSIKENATRLGLTWQLRSATVQANFIDGTGNSTVTTSGAVPIVYDGDSVPLTAVSLIGIPAGASRVMCIQVPPSGNYIIGNMMGFVPSQLVLRAQLDGSAVASLTTSPVAVVGMDTEFQLTGSYFWKAEVFYDFSVSATGGTNCIGTFTGPAGPENAQVVLGIPTAGIRGTVGMIYSGVGSGNAPFTFFAQKQAAGGTAVLNGARAIVEIYQ